MYPFLLHKSLQCLQSLSTNYIWYFMISRNIPKGTFTCKHSKVASTSENNYVAFAPLGLYYLTQNDSFQIHLLTWKKKNQRIHWWLQQIRNQRHKEVWFLGNPCWNVVGWRGCLSHIIPMIIINWFIIFIHLFIKKWIWELLFMTNFKISCVTSTDSISRTT